MKWHKQVIQGKNLAKNGRLVMACGKEVNLNWTESCLQAFFAANSRVFINSLFRIADVNR